MPCKRRLLGVAGAIALAAVLVAPAAATPATLKRSVENLTQWPLDVVIAPYTAGKAIYTNLQEIDDSLAVKIVYPVPGYVWNLGVNWGAAVLRGVTGAIEFIPGVVLLFTSADMEPLFDPADDNHSLVDWENGIYDLKFGIDYTTPAF